MGRFRLAIVACACLLLAACGGTTTKQSSIRRTVAVQLANRSDALATALRRGNSCEAARQARALRLRVASAIVSGSIPRSLAAPARIASSHLAGQIVCSPRPPAPPSTASVTCAGIDARKNALEQEKHALGKGEKGKAAGARRKEIDQEEHALDQQRKGCK